MKNTPLKISLIEDDDDDIFLFSMALENATTPNSLTIIKDGTDVEKNIGVLESTNPDIIFLDMLWKYTDGVDYIQKIKSSAVLKEKPCVIFSGSKEESDIQNAFQAGANLYIVKPGDYTILADMINRTLTLDWKEYFPPEYESFCLAES